MREVEQRAALTRDFGPWRSSRRPWVAVRWLGLYPCPVAASAAADLAPAVGPAKGLGGGIPGPANAPKEGPDEAYLSAQCEEAGQAPRLPSPHVRPGRPSHHQGSTSQGPSAAVRLIGRVRDRRTFAELRRSPRRARSGPLTVAFVPGGPDESARVAYAIGKRTGGAVQRNQVRRRLRALVSDLAPELEPGAYLIGAAAEAVPLSHGELRSHLSRALSGLT